MMPRVAEPRQGDCAICGAMSVLVRPELFRFVEALPPPSDGEPPILFKFDYRCLDRARCQADVEALAKAWNPADGPAPRWNIADGHGPAAVVKPRSSWQARAGATAPPDRPEIAPPVSVPVTPIRPTRRRSSAPRGLQRTSW